MGYVQHCLHNQIDLGKCSLSRLRRALGLPLCAAFQFLFFKHWAVDLPSRYGETRVTAHSRSFTQRIGLIKIGVRVNHIRHKTLVATHTSAKVNALEGLLPVLLPPRTCTGRQRSRRWGRWTQSASGGGAVGIICLTSRRSMRDLALCNRIIVLLDSERSGECLQHATTEK
jgi:hypothetical protein